MRKHIILLMLLLLSFSIVSAEVLQNTVCTVPKETTIEGNLYAFCRDLIIEGRVDGSVFAASFTTDISGEIGENLYLLGVDAALRGAIDGDIHFAGISFIVHPNTQFGDTNYNALSLSSELQRGVELPGSVVGLGYQLLIEGNVARDVDYWGSVLSLDGWVRGDISATVGDVRRTGTASQIGTLLVFLPNRIELSDPGLFFGDRARIDGDLEYTAYESVDVAAVVRGMTTYTQRVDTNVIGNLTDEEVRAEAINNYLSLVVREFLTLTILGAVMITVLPTLVQTVLIYVRRRPVTSAGIGVMTFTLSFPVFLLTLALSVLVIAVLSLIPINGLLLASGLLFGLVNLGGVSLFYFVAIYVSRVIIVIAIGRWIVHQFNPRSTFTMWMISLAIGALLVSLVVSLPVIGLILNGIALFIGLGAIFIVIQSALRRMREASVSSLSRTGGVLAAEPIGTGAPQLSPPPILETTSQRPRGMDNLPDGFVWWDDQE